MDIKQVGILHALSAIFESVGGNDLPRRKPKTRYAGLSKNSPSHAQQKRNSIKRKNKQGK